MENFVLKSSWIHRPVIPIANRRKKIF